MPTNTSIAARAARSTGGFKSGAQFPLRAGYYTPAKMPLNVIYPRPDVETQSHARHRWAHSQMLYEIPIGVQGGAWPFKYEVIYDTSGAASIGQFYGDANYGVLRINNALLAQGQSYDYTVRVTGCDGVYVDISRTVTVDDSKFVFVQAGYAGTKVGTITQPLATFADWWGASISDSAYHNKIMVWRSGEYSSVTVPDENSGNLRLQASTKTCQFLGFPGEEPIINMSLSKLLDDSTASHDFYSAGITWKNARTDVANSHFFWFTGNSNRITFFKNKFKDMLRGTVNDDNSNPIFVNDNHPNVDRNYFLACWNTFDNINLSGGANNGGLIDIYKTSNILCELNTVKNCNTYGGFWLKGTVANVTVRGNIAWENNQGGLFMLGYGSEAHSIPHDHELCWNNFNTTGVCVTFANSDTYAGQSYNTFIYRNALQGSSSICRYPGSENFVVEANMLNFASYSNWTEGIQDQGIGNIKSATDINAAGELTGAAGFGTHGWRPY